MYKLSILIFAQIFFKFAKSTRNLSEKLQFKLIDVSNGFILTPNVILDTFRVVLSDEQGPKSKMILNNVVRNAGRRFSVHFPDSSPKIENLHPNDRIHFDQTLFFPISKNQSATNKKRTTRRSTLSERSSIEVISESRRRRYVSEGNESTNSQNSGLSSGYQVISEGGTSASYEKVEIPQKESSNEMSSSLETRYYSAKSNFEDSDQKINPSNQTESTSSNNQSADSNSQTLTGSSNSNSQFVNSNFQSENQGRKRNKPSTSSYEVISENGSEKSETQGRKRNKPSTSSYEVISDKSASSFEVISDKSTSSFEIISNNSDSQKNSSDSDSDRKSSTDESLNYTQITDDHPVNKTTDSLDHLPITRFLTADYVTSHSLYSVNEEEPLTNSFNNKIGTNILSKTEAVRALNSSLGFFSSNVWNFRNVLYTPTVESSVSPYYNVFLYQSEASFESLYIHIVKKNATPQNFVVFLNLVPILGNICSMIPQIFSISTNTKMPVSIVNDEAGLIQIEYVDNGTEDEVLFYVCRLGIANSAKYVQSNPNLIDVSLNSDVFTGSTVMFTITTQKSIIPNSFSIPNTNKDISLRKIFNLLNTYKKSPKIDEKSLKMIETQSMIEEVGELFLKNWKENDGHSENEKLKITDKIEEGLRLNNISYLFE